MNMKTFKEFLVEYSFKKALPKGICKIYPIHFSDEEVLLFKDIDDWEFEPHKCGCDQLSSMFIKGQEYKIGKSKIPCKVIARRFRDRIRLTLDEYPSNEELNHPKQSPSKKQSFDIKFESKDQLKRLICQVLKKVVD